MTSHFRDGGVHRGFRQSAVKIKHLNQSAGCCAPVAVLQLTWTCHPSTSQTAFTGTETVTRVMDTTSLILQKWKSRATALFPGDLKAEMEQRYVQFLRMFIYRFTSDGVFSECWRDLRAIQRKSCVTVTEDATKGFVSLVCVLLLLLLLLYVCVRETYPLRSCLSSAATLRSSASISSSSCEQNTWD